MNYKFKTKPYQHQLKALELSWEKSYFAYFMEMGTGKSKVLLDNIARLYDQGKIDGALIVAPKGVIGTWYNQEIPAHLPDHIENVTVLWQANITKGQSKKLGRLFKTGEELHILIMNVEAFSTQKGVDFAAKFLNCHNSLMAVDESTTIKNPDAKRTKNICKLAPYAKYRRILTGSPVTKSPLDLYKQCDFLQPELLDHTSYYTFRTRYAVMKRIVKLTPAQEKVYKQMKHLALAEMEGKQMTTATVLTQLMRLHQITCGHFTADDGTIKDINNNRLDELLNVLDEVEGKAVIWAHYQHDVEGIIERIRKEYGFESAVDYYGLTPPSERQENIRKFQNDDKCRFFVGTTQTGGYGITLTAASTMIYYSNGYDLEKRQQSEARIDRIGQKFPMTYIDIMAEDTIDERIVKALRKKVNIATQIMGEELKAWI
jgi:SNF2 family DNA or RNA helicase